MASYGRGSLDSPVSSYQSGAQGGDEATRLANAVGNNIQKIASNVTRLERLVQQIGTQSDSESIRDQVHEITHSTNGLAKDTNRDMQAFAHLKPTGSNATQLKMQKERLAELFSNALKDFQTVQRTAASKEKASISRARAASQGGTGFSPYQDEQGAAQFTQEGFSATKQVLAMENDVDLKLIQERESAIKQLESDIMDVNQIFKDLGMLVHEQGEVLDSIEANIDSTHMKVEDGTKQLASARNYQSKARRKKCCLISVLLIILAIIIIIVVVTVSQKSSN